MTIDMLNGQKRMPYTNREILQQEYPFYWGGVNELVRILRELQNLLVELMPVYRSGSSRLSAQLDNKNIQSIFLSYIKCRILYAFAEAVWKRTVEHCLEIATKPVGNDSAKVALIYTFEVFDKYSLIDIVRYEENGYTLMKEMIEEYEHGFDFIVILPALKYTDIVAKIENNGLQDEQFLKFVLAYQDPREANIGKMFDDNEPQRMY